MQQDRVLWRALEHASTTVLPNWMIATVAKDESRNCSKRPSHGVYDCWRSLVGWVVESWLLGTRFWTAVMDCRGRAKTKIFEWGHICV